MRALRPTFVLLIILLLLPLPVLAAGYLDRDDVVAYELPMYFVGTRGQQISGTLHFSTPEAWKMTLLHEPATMVQLSTPNDSQAGIQVIHLDCALEAADSQLRTVAQRIGLEHLPQAVENSLALHLLEGPKVRGFYFTLTDKAPLPDEWEFLTVGILHVGDAVWFATLLSHEKEGQDFHDALNLWTYADFTIDPQFCPVT